VKRDDLSSPEYGGNKPRKLELILAWARERGAQTLVTFGGLGTNHGLATAIYGKKLGFRVILILTPQPITEYVIRNLYLMVHFGAEVIPTKGPVYAAYKALKVLLRGERHYMIPPGGSSALGTLGFVNAAFELKDQLHQGNIPEPDYVFLPLGSCGTAAGLGLGMKMAGLSSHIVAVRVYDRIASNSYTVDLLQRRTITLLKKLVHEIPLTCARGASASGGLVSPRGGGIKGGEKDVIVLHKFFGGGYGVPTEDGAKAMEMAMECEGMHLDPTYSGKAMAGFIDFVRSGRARGKRLLFWNTYNSAPMDDILKGLSPKEMAERLPLGLVTWITETSS